MFDARLIRYAFLSLLGTLPVQAAQLVPSSQPLFLNQSVAPNIFVTLDDSGSMTWGFAPDSRNAYDRRYFKSKSYNAIYYDPAVDYQVPKQVTFQNGASQVTDYPTPDFNAAWRNGFIGQNSGTVNLSWNYRATIEYDYYRQTNREAAYTAGNFYNFNSSRCNPSNDSHIRTESCYDAGTLDTEEKRTNFAIWYSYYRTRELATQSSASLAFYRLPENIRLTWQTLNSDCNSLGEGTKTQRCYENFLRQFSGKHRENFYSFLKNFSSNGGTPLKSAMVRAGNFLYDDTVNGPYAEKPGESIGNKYSCRASYHLLMTDGIWNDGSINGEQDFDSQNKALPDRRNYTPRLPFSDKSAGNYNNRTLADLAFYYWSNDARDDIGNNVKPYIPFASKKDVKDLTDAEYFDARNNPATWQHLVNYTIGLGLSGSLTKDPRWEGSTYAGGYGKLIAGTANWPNATSNDADNNVYDLWHAAINSRGEFFAADTPDSLANAFQTVLSRINDRQTSAAAVGALSGRLTKDNELYYVRFDSNDWSGQLLKYKIDNATQDPVVDWDARELLNGASSRNIKFASKKALAQLKWTSLTAEQQRLLSLDDNGTVDNLGEARLNYVLGDRSQESGGKFRERKYLLGDIIGSSPVVVGEAESPDLLINDLNRVGGVNNYSDFITAQQSRKKRIYVGANDGMLHGFDKDGKEAFAFVPSAVFGNLRWLSSPRYKGNMHRYFVDGTPVTAEIVVDGQWRTILIGTLRAGGTALFALDVTKPGEEKLLWEFSAADDADLGYTFGEPTVSKLHDGSWGVILGNGYGSQNDKAALLVLDAATGKLLKKLTPNTGSSVNGLSMPRVIDINGDLVADYVYAGDLQGNLWRFDLFGTGTDSLKAFNADGTIKNGAIGDWRIAFGGKPLYRAVVKDDQGIDVAQPITAPPSLVLHPLQRGYVVVFGTGRYVTNDDATPKTNTSMSLYGIWDNRMNPETDDASTTTTLSRNDLVAQTLTAAATATFSDPDETGSNREYRRLSSNTVQWYGTDGTIAKRGWYIDLKDGNTREGEMLIHEMRVRARVILANTVIPESDPCKPGVSSWLMAFDGATGSATRFNVLDLTRNRRVNDRDSFTGQIISVVRNAGFGSPTVIGDRIYGNSPDGLQSPEMFTTGPDSRGRQTWRLLDEEDDQQ